MAKRQRIDSTDAMRRALAWQEERMMLYRELAKVNESLLKDLLDEVVKARPVEILDQVEKEMKEAGLFQPDQRA